MVPGIKVEAEFLESSLTTGLALSLAICSYVHQDSMHQAILSKCTASEFVLSVQSSDELKMYAWMEIILVYIIIITLGKPISFEERRVPF